MTLPQRGDGAPPPSHAPPRADGQPGAGRPGGGGLGGLDQNDPVVAKALAACQDRRPAPGSGGRGGAGQLSQATKDCLSGKGVTVPDGQALDRSDPAVQAALQACRPAPPGASTPTTVAG